MGEVAAVGVVADLVARPEDVERVLALEDLEHEVRHDVAQRELDVAAHDVRVADGPALADADAVERTDDGVRQLELLPGALGEVLRGELLEAVGRDRRRRGQLGAFGRREGRRRLVDHRAADDDDPLEAPGAMGGDGGVEGRREDALVLGQQVVGEFVEVADPADHRGGRDDLVAVGDELAHERGVLGVALDEPVARMVVVRLREPAVLAEVVEPDDLVAGLEQLRDEVAVDEPGGAGDEDAH